MKNNDSLFGEFDKLPSSNPYNLPEAPSAPIVVMPTVPTLPIMPKAPSYRISEKSVLQDLQTNRNRIFNEYVNLMQSIVFDSNLNECYYKYKYIGKKSADVNTLLKELEKLDNAIKNMSKGGSRRNKTEKKKHVHSKQWNRKKNMFTFRNHRH
jgi:hypothetical protein